AADGSIAVQASLDAGVQVVVRGWFPATSAFVTQDPQRVFTFPTASVVLTSVLRRIPPPKVNQVDVTGVAGIPETGVGAVILRVTATAPVKHNRNLSIWTRGGTKPAKPTL